MIYFSELQSRRVVTVDQVDVGRLEDVIFLASENPSVTKIIVRGFLKEKLIIPTSYIRKLNNPIVIGKEYVVSSLEENELHLVKNLLDKQIIDIKGNKVVRVNDVAIQDKGGLYIAGVDIGLLGILRSLRLEEPFISFLARFGLKLTSRFLSWGDIQPLELVHGAVKLRKKEEKLQRIPPEDLADYLERTNIVTAQKFLRILDEKKVAEVIGNLNLNYRAALFRNYKPDRAAHLLALIDPDEAVDILLTLQSKKRQMIFEKLPKEKQKQYNQLLNYSKTQIGQIMTSEFLTVNAEDQVKEVIRKIKLETSEFSFLRNIYVMNDKKQLIGVFNLHELFLQDEETLVYKFMIQNVIVIYVTTPAEIALNKIKKYKLTTLPVIDNNKNILGMVTVDDLIQFFDEKSYEV